MQRMENTAGSGGEERRVSERRVSERRVSERE